MSSDKQTSKRSKVNHNLKDYFDGIQDEAIIQDLNSYGTIREWSKATLKAVATLEALHAPSGSSPNESTDHHQAILYYLKTHRPAILLQADKEAEDLAKHWPGNYKDLRVFLAKGWWWNAIRRRLSDLLRKRHANLSPNDWVRLIWPVCVHIMAEDPELDTLRVQDAEYRLVSMVFIPTRATYKGQVIYKEIKKMLRHRIMDYRAKNPIRAEED